MTESIDDILPDKINTKSKESQNNLTSKKINPNYYFLFVFIIVLILGLLFWLILKTSCSWSQKPNKYNKSISPTSINLSNKKGVSLDEITFLQKPENKLAFKYKNELIILDINGNLNIPLSKNSNQPVYVNNFDFYSTGPSLLVYSTGDKDKNNSLCTDKINAFLFSDKTIIPLELINNPQEIEGKLLCNFDSDIKFSHSGNLLAALINFKNNNKQQSRLNIYDTKTWKNIETYNLPESFGSDYRNIIFSLDDTLVYLTQITSPETSSGVLINRQDNKVIDLEYEFGGAVFASGQEVIGFDKNNNLIIYEKYWPENIDFNKDYNQVKPTINKVFLADLNGKKLQILINKIEASDNGKFNQSFITYQPEEKTYYVYDFINNEKYLLLDYNDPIFKDYIDKFNIISQINNTWYVSIKGNLKAPYNTVIFEIKKDQKPIPIVGFEI